MKELMIDGVKFRQQFRRCCASCQHGQDGQGHGPYWYALKPDSRLHYVGRELPPLVVEHQRALEAQRVEIANRRADLVQQLRQLEKQAEHVQGLIRAVDGLTLGFHIDAPRLKELEFGSFSKVLEAL